jgi:hypothetical protein
LHILGLVLIVLSQKVAVRLALGSVI